jgi:hypothetical protein
MLGNRRLRGGSEVNNFRTRRNYRERTCEVDSVRGGEAEDCSKVVVQVHYRDEWSLAASYNFRCFQGNFCASKALIRLESLSFI